MADRKFSAAPAAKNTWKYVRSNLLTVLTILGIIFGIAFGFILRNYKQDKWTQRELVYVKIIGEIFLRMLKAISLPLILSSVIAALGSLDLRLSGKVGIRTLFFYVTSTLCAVILGVILVATVHPGVHNQNEKLQHPGSLKARKILNEDVMMDVLR